MKVNNKSLGGTVTKIMVVEDCLVNRTLLLKMLAERFKHIQVIEAINGEDAVEKFSKAQPDMILMDIKMPIMDGYQSAQIIKNLCNNNHVPIIFITSVDEDDTLSKALNSGGDDFISKPINTSVLESKVKAHLRIAQLNKQLNEKNAQLELYNQQLIKDQNLVTSYFDKTFSACDIEVDAIRYNVSPMSKFSGDIILVKRSPDNDLYVILGDFTGHGLPAAMGTLPVALVFFKMVEQCCSVEALIEELNKQLFKLLPTGIFFAATVMKLNSEGNQLQVLNSGMPSVYWLDAKNELKGEINSSHPALGILEALLFSNAVKTIDVEVNDKFYLYSDGITEAENPDGEMFGEERLHQFITAQKGDVFVQLLSTINDYTQSYQQTDDITLLELTCIEY